MSNKTELQSDKRKELAKQLIHATQAGDIEAIQEALDAGASIDDIDEDSHAHHILRIHDMFVALASKPRENAEHKCVLLFYTHGD